MLNSGAAAFLESEETLNEFLAHFEQGTWPKPEWNHAAHLAVAGCYLVENPEEDVPDRVRRGIRHYNDCNGTINSDHSGYHETLTLFWLAVVKAWLGEARGRAAASGSDPAAGDGICLQARSVS